MMPQEESKCSNSDCHVNYTFFDGSDGQSQSGRLKRARSLDFGGIFRKSHGHQLDSCSRHPRSSSRSNLELLDQKDNICNESKSWLSCTDRSNPWSAEEIERATKIEFRFPIAKMTLGKVTVVLLILATLIDFGVSHIHRLESPADYDALSADVIRPPFPYQSNINSPRQARLGSAAINSITHALSPILPFAGGLDLRREDYWKTPGSWFDRVRSVYTQVYDAFVATAPDEGVVDIRRGGGNVPSSVTKRRSKKSIKVIGSPKPFMAESKIAELTLGDVAEAFRYAIDSSKTGFSEHKFRLKKSPRVLFMIKKMKAAVAESRGVDTLDALVSSHDQAAASIDSLKFSAALRIFAEWRVIRQVPEGYKGYAVGMGLGHKDVVQNLVKIEQAVHEMLDHRRDLLVLQEQLEGRPSAEVVRTPTLRELLQHEVDLGVHPRLPRLKEKSAGMGLLWVRRQIQYQTGIFSNILQVPRKFKDTEAAVAGAYKDVYDRFHGWAVQKIFNYSFQSAPDAAVIYRHMNPHRMKEVLKAADNIVSSKPTTEIPVNDENETHRNGFIHYWGGEWDKFAASVGRRFGGKSQQKIAIRGGDMSGNLESEKSRFITQEMVKDAHMHIGNYLEVAVPLLDNLADVFAELNMNDLTKV